jgi:hypothetical protein
MQRVMMITAASVYLFGAARPASAAFQWWWKPVSRTNTAPTISGSPPRSVVVNQGYFFKPSATDAERNTLIFSISNKPVWASFSASTGALSGTPSSTQKGTYNNIVISVSDGSLRSSLPAFGIVVSDASPTPVGNTAPIISGTPATSVVAGSAYSFKPSASDADGNTLAFSISGKPSWATFSTATGTLGGTPTASQTGTYSSIVISVSDGMATKSLPTFAITVRAAASTGSAALSWTAPSQNTDGSIAGNLAGYRVYHGLSENTLNEMIVVPGAGSSSYTFTQLAPGTHYFAVSAYNSAGTEGVRSPLGSKTIQ